jgi:hypothetical protein
VRSAASLYPGGRTQAQTIVVNFKKNIRYGPEHIGPALFCHFAKYPDYWMRLPIRLDPATFQYSRDPISDRF